MTTITYCVPAYNVESYIIECLNSIKLGGIDDYEIIVVDDCSTDNTFEVLQDISRQDRKISIYKHEENLGLPEARNTALKHAQGEFIRHVDGDDLIVEGSSKLLLNAIENSNADISRGSSFSFDEDGNTHEMIWANRGIENIDIIDVQKSDFFKNNVLGYVWLYLYRASFLKNIGSIKFDSKYSILEDDLYNSKVLPVSSKIALVDSAVTLYRLGGMSSGRFWTFREYIEQSDVLRLIYSNRELDEEFKECYINHKFGFVVDKLFDFFKAQLSLEQFYQHFFSLHEVYKNINFDLYVGDGIKKNGLYQSYYKDKANILRLIKENRADELYNLLKR